MKYIALTIGPIIQTLSQARKTRELWAASYLFSFLMKKIISYLIEKGIKREQFILPFVTENDLSAKAQKVGLYPDRCILKAAGNDDFTKLIEAVDDAIMAVATGISRLPNSNTNTAESFGHLKNYFKTYAISVELTQEDPISAINSFLDNLEQQQVIHSPDTINPLAELLDKATHSFLAEDAFNMKEISFDTIPEYATRELLNKNRDKYEMIVREYIEDRDAQKDDEFMEALKEAFGEDYHSYHKYFCIVHADGDNTGSIIKALKNDVDKFSKELLVFSKDAAGIIEDFQGVPIYTGGDDLLFWAPVVSSKGNIFQLIEELRKKFNDLISIDPRFHIKSVYGEKILPTLSFGLSISYYKFPLFEALELSRKQLENAKYYSDPRSKNAISWILLKHSGSAISHLMSFNSPLYHEQFSVEGKKESLFFALLNSRFNDKEFLGSVANKARENEGLIGLFKNIANDNQLENRVKALFDIHFDRENKKMQEEFLNLSEKLFISILKDEWVSNVGSAFYNILSTIKFVKGLDDEH